MKLRRLFSRDEVDDASGDDVEDDEPQADDVDDGEDAISTVDDRDADRADAAEDETDSERDVGDGEAPHDVADEDADSDGDDTDDTDDTDEADGTDGVDEEGDEDDDADDDDDEDREDEDNERESQQTVFALNDWGARERQLLDNELGVNRIRCVWEAGDLVVARPDEAAVSELIDLIEYRVSLDLSPDAEPVIYDIGDWPPGLEDKFAEELVDARIPHARGYQEITIGIDDEERVDEIVERISREWESDQAEAEEPDDLDAQQVLSDLFLGADRLTHSPKSKSDAKAFESAASAAAELKLPFGFEQTDWDALLEQVTALTELLSDEESYEDDIMDAAGELRSRLRTLV